MIKHLTPCLAVALLVATALLWAGDASTPPTSMDMTMQMPVPQPEHAWLQKFVGRWEAEGRMSIPDMPEMTWTGTESVRSLGGFWILAEGEGVYMDMPMSTVLTLGFDPQSSQYVGTWIDSGSSHMWKYTGTLDQGGNTLTLETEGPCPWLGGKVMKFRDVVEFKSDDHRIMTSSIRNDDGTWEVMGSADYRRKP